MQASASRHRPTHISRAPAGNPAGNPDNPLDNPLDNNVPCRLAGQARRARTGHDAA